MPNSSPGFPTLHTRTQCSQITELGQEAVCGCSSADDDARMRAPMDRQFALRPP